MSLPISGLLGGCPFFRDPLAGLTPNPGIAYRKVAVIRKTDFSRQYSFLSTGLGGVIAFLIRGFLPIFSFVVIF